MVGQDLTVVVDHAPGTSDQELSGAGRWPASLVSLHFWGDVADCLEDPTQRGYRS
jgi:hypothetical protein